MTSVRKRSESCVALRPQNQPTAGRRARSGSAPIAPLEFYVRYDTPTDGHDKTPHVDRVPRLSEFFERQSTMTLSPSSVRLKVPERFFISFARVGIPASVEFIIEKAQACTLFTANLIGKWEEPTCAKTHVGTQCKKPLDCPLCFLDFITESQHVLCSKQLRNKDRCTCERFHFTDDVLTRGVAPNEKRFFAPGSDTPTCPVAYVGGQCIYLGREKKGCHFVPRAPAGQPQDPKYHTHNPKYFKFMGWGHNIEKDEDRYDKVLDEFVSAFAHCACDEEGNPEYLDLRAVYKVIYDSVFTPRTPRQANVPCEQGERGRPQDDPLPHYQPPTGHTEQPVQGQSQPGPSRRDFPRRRSGVAQRGQGARPEGQQDRKEEYHHEDSSSQDSPYESQSSPYESSPASGPPARPTARLFSLPFISMVLGAVYYQTPVP